MILGGIISSKTFSKDEFDVATFTTSVRNQEFVNLSIVVSKNDCVLHTVIIGGLDPNKDLFGVLDETNILDYAVNEARIKLDRLMDESDINTTSDSVTLVDND